MATAGILAWRPCASARPHARLVLLSPVPLGVSCRRRCGYPASGRQTRRGLNLRTYTRRLMTVRTFSPKAADVERQWHVIDASDVVLGRLASHTATLLRGKHKPIFAPHVDTGDFVIIVNAAKVALSGNKLADKRAYRHSGYPGGLRS